MHVTLKLFPDKPSQLVFIALAPINVQYGQNKHHANCILTNTRGACCNHSKSHNTMGHWLGWEDDTRRGRRKRWDEGGEGMVGSP